MNEDAAAALCQNVARLAAARGARVERAQRIADAIRAAFGYRWVGVYTVGDTLVTVEAWSGPAAPAFPRFPRDSGLTGAAVAAGSVVLSNDVAVDPRYLTNLDTTGSELIAPVIAGDRVVGTIDLESDRRGAFPDTDVEVARRLAAEIVPLWQAQ